MMVAPCVRKKTSSNYEVLLMSCLIIRINHAHSTFFREFDHHQQRLERTITEKCLDAF